MNNISNNNNNNNNNINMTTGEKILKSLMGQEKFIEIPHPTTPWLSWMSRRTMVLLRSLGI